MKYSLPILALLLLAAGGLALGHRFSQPSAATAQLSSSAGLPRESAAAADPTAASAQSEVTADAVLLACARRLATVPSLSATLRFEVNLLGHQLVGTGGYRQLGKGAEQRFRYEIKVQHDGGTSSLTQIGDDRFLWERRDVAGSVELGRIDLRRLSEALEDHPLPPARTRVLGGVQRLLSSLREDFHWQPPQAAKYAGRQVWILRGAWRGARLKEILGPRYAEWSAGEGTLDELLPPQLPTDTLVVVGQESKLPVRIDFNRTAGQAPRSPTQVFATRPLASVEWFDVLIGAAIDPLLFSFDAGDDPVKDRTTSVIKRLKAAESQTP